MLTTEEKEFDFSMSINVVLPLSHVSIYAVRRPRHGAIVPNKLNTMDVYGSFHTFKPTPCTAIHACRCHNDAHLETALRRGRRHKYTSLVELVHTWCRRSAI